MGASDEGIVGEMGEGYVGICGWHAKDASGMRVEAFLGVCIQGESGPSRDGVSV